MEDAAPALLRAPEAEEDILVGEEQITMRTDVVAVDEATRCKCIRDASAHDATEI